MNEASTRRQLLKVAGATALSAFVPATGMGNTQPNSVSLGSGVVRLVSDGNLSFPARALFESEEQSKEAKRLFKEANIPWGVFEPPLNITVWQSGDRLVLFDVGSGSQFMETAGLLPIQLEAAGIDPLTVTDVVLTHAHPDHCWGLLDDFDDLLCPDATYHINGLEFDYWLSEKTLSSTPEAGLAMVAGARNRLPLIESQMSRFKWGDEIIPGIEAIDSHGHTAGHTSFAIHQADESLLVLGDALTHPVISFQRPKWRWPTDQDPDAAVISRKKLLDRMVTEQARFVGYHLPTPGLGTVARKDSAFQFSPENM